MLHILKRQEYAVIDLNYMLHELLMALLGQPGAIIKSYNQTFAVDPAATILSEPETAMISQMAQTGYYYQQLTSFIRSQKTQISFADISKDPSIYRKAMAQGLQKAIQEYQQLILSIERDFLANRHFTFSNIRSQLTKYEIVMKDLWIIVQKIVSQKYRGGVIIDIFWQSYHKGNAWVKSWACTILKECQQVFLNQAIAWIAHGQLIDGQAEFFIHKVIQEPQEKVQFMKLSNKNVEITGWDIYTLDTQLIPLSIVSQETAAKILFIGKSVKILRSSGKISAIPSKNILSDIREIFKQDYCQIAFESTIEQIRKAIAEQMIRLIIGEQNLIRQLQKINEYYLMLKGDFYHHFLEQSKCIQQISNKQKAQRRINQTCLQNTFIRLNNQQDSKRVFFEIKALGFSYIGFKNFLNICPVGSIDLVQGKYIRFSCSEGGIWHRTKQVVENNFTIMFSLCFIKSKNIFKTKREDILDKRSNIISLVIQNQRDIAPSLHQNPSALNKIHQYVAINIGYRYSQNQKNYQSILIVTYKNQKKYAKEVEIGKLIPKKINFLDQRIYYIKLTYQNDQLKVSINPINTYDISDQNSLKIDQIRLSSYLNLEMNRANIGILSSIKDFDCQAQIEQWQMVCKPTNYYGDHWSDLSLNLKINWPLNLILTPDLMQIFSRINKFLFPIRQIQIQLERIWMKVPRRFKQAKLQVKSRGEWKQISIFQRRVSSTRYRMNMMVNNLWSYFESDVVQTAWFKLKMTLSRSDDFEDVIRMINKYVNTIQTMFYFNALKIQRYIHEIIRQSRNFVAFFNKLQNQHIDGKTMKQYENIDDIFRKNVTDFHKLLKELSKTSNSTHLFHLTQRVDGCIQQQDKFLNY